MRGVTHYGNAIIPAWAGSSLHDNEYYMRHDQCFSTSCYFHSIAPYVFFFFNFAVINNFLVIIYRKSSLLAFMAF